MLENYIRQKRQEKDILLMTHIVIGYPSFEKSMQLVETMVGAGVDLMELQIPFSEPIADGPVILAANQNALEAGASVRQCIDFGGTVAARFDIPFLFMTYYNILHRYGVGAFVEAMAAKAIQGAIVPDLPPEEGNDYINAMARQSRSPIFIYAPTTPIERMKYLAGFAGGFIYCVARKGVTGADTDFSTVLAAYLGRARKASNLPLAVGFGVKNKADVDFLTGKADIAVVGTETIRIMEQKGLPAVAEFIRSLR